MRIKKQHIAIAAVPIMIAGWALFRPELLFVNQTVSEQLVSTQSQGSELLLAGSFTSQAHETKGKVEVVRSGGKTYLQLSDFHTSNGPDVRIYLLKGTQAEGSDVLRRDYIDLGAIKGNIGNQKYELPANFDAEQYRAVSIWCERFSVGFGAATLESKNQSAQSQVQSKGVFNPTSWTAPPARLAAFGAPVEVTFGSAMGNKQFQGKASIIEDAGKRWVQFKLQSVPAGNWSVRLVKKETLSLGAFPEGVAYEALGTLKSKDFKVSASKSLDLWLYRSIAVLDSKGRITAYFHLRSAQEAGRNLLLA